MTSGWSRPLNSAAAQPQAVQIRTLPSNGFSWTSQKLYAGLVMGPIEFFRNLKSREHRLAWLIAIAADALQIGVFPVFMEGALSPFDDALDVIVAATLWRLLGWHWALLPSLAAELVPGLDLIPTWTAAVFFITRQQVHSQEPEILPPGPAPARRP